MGTPAGSSQAGSMEGERVAATVKREFGCAAGRPQPGVHSLPVQSVSFGGAFLRHALPHTSPSGVSATLVKMVSALTASMQFGLVS